MSSALWSAREGFSLSANTTYFCIVGAGLHHISTANTVEVNVQVPQRTAGTHSLLYINCIVNGVTASSTFTFRKNGANGNQVISIGSGITGEFTDSTHTDAVVSGDLCNVQEALGATGTTLNVISVSGLFNAASNRTVRYVFNRIPAANALSNSTQFVCITGFFAFDNTNTEGNTQAHMKVGGSWSNYCWKVTANAKTVSSTGTMRLNGANTAVTMSVGAGVTGNIEDTTHSFSSVVDDLVCQALFYGNDANNLTAALTAIDFTVTGNILQYFCQFANHSFNHADTEFSSFLGEYGVNTPETQWQNRPLIAGTVSMMSMTLVNNAVTASSTRTWRTNAVNGNQTLSIGASISGYFLDSTHSDIVAATDELTIAYANGATGADTGVVVQQSVLFSVPQLSGGAGGWLFFGIGP